MKLNAAVPQVTSPNSRHSTFMLLLTIDIRPNMHRMINVTVASTRANAHEESPAALISSIFTRKSSLMSCNTVMNRLAKNSIISTGIKLLNRFRRALLSNVTLSVRSSLSACVGWGIRVISHPKKDKSGKANAPIKAGIQNSLICKLSITKSPIDFAVPELIAMLSPIRLASKSVTRLPSRKLKITPHMHPKESPLKNRANTLKGCGSAPKRTRDSSATATERIINFSRFSFFSSEITLMPISLEIK